jgi:Putative rhamnosyl transferase
MSVKFTHYLITRFNVNIRGNGPELIRQEVRTAGWELERMPLFEKICVPSVLGQTCRDFVWLIYCDTETSESILRRIREAVNQITNVEIHQVSGFDELKLHLQQKCAQSKTPFVITSRLDNDDAIGKQYIETVQTHFIPQDQILLNPLGGVNYHISLKLLTHLRHKELNHFISLIERTKEASEFCTIMGFSHLHPKENMVVKNIPLTYAFWITLHAHNAAPRKNRGWPVFLSSIVKNYSLDPAQTPVSWRNTILYTIGWIPGAILRKLKYQMHQLSKRNIKRG